MVANKKLGPWPPPDITLFSRLYEYLKTLVLPTWPRFFLHLGCFCLAYQYFLCRLAVCIPVDSYQNDFLCPVI